MTTFVLPSGSPTLARALERLGDWAAIADSAVAVEFWPQPYGRPLCGRCLQPVYACGGMGGSMPALAAAAQAGEPNLFQDLEALLALPPDPDECWWLVCAACASGSG